MHLCQNASVFWHGLWMTIILPARIKQKMLLTVYYRKNRL
ncbi:hypothetical protein J522_0350 [Acinetobacter baumannii 146457]|nr:hypothetical protein J522_0350 [Acinetobacter baumannii 146457]